MTRETLSRPRGRGPLGNGEAHGVSRERPRPVVSLVVAVAAVVIWVGFGTTVAAYCVGAGAVIAAAWHQARQADARRDW